MTKNQLNEKDLEYFLEKGIEFYCEKDFKYPDIRRRNFFCRKFFKEWYDFGINGKILQILNILQTNKRDFYSGGITPKEFNVLEEEVRKLKNVEADFYKKIENPLERNGERISLYDHITSWVANFLGADLGLFDFSNPLYKTERTGNSINKSGIYFGVHKEITDFIFEKIKREKGFIMQATFCVPYKFKKDSFSYDFPFEIVLKNCEELSAKINKIKKVEYKKIDRGYYFTRFPSRAYIGNLIGHAPNGNFIVKPFEGILNKYLPKGKTEIIIASTDEEYIDNTFQEIKDLVHAKNKVSK